MSDRPLAVVLVAAVDRRVLPAVAVLPQLAGSDARALHIAMDAAQSYRVARDWMDFGISSLPLQVEEPSDPSLATCVRHVVEREAAGRSRVTVIVPEMVLGRWWQPLLHRSTGRAIAWELAGMAGVTTIVVPVPVELGVRAARMTG